MTSISISHRHDDSPELVRRISAELKKRIKPGDDSETLIDTTSISQGPEFHESLTSAIRSSEVLLVMIGKNWLSDKDDEGRTLIQCPSDVVRTEIESAFVSDVPVVPVLVGGATLPATAKLPPSLHNLATTIASPVRGSAGFDDDMECLIERINHHLKTPINANHNHESNDGQNRSPKRQFFGRTSRGGRKFTTAFLAIAIALAGALLFQPFSRWANIGSRNAEIPVAIPFMARTKQEFSVYSGITGTINVHKNSLQLSATSGTIESKLKTAEFVQTVRFGLAKKTYAFDRFRVISWAEPHNVGKWVDSDSSLSLRILDTTIPIPPSVFEPSAKEDDSPPLKDHWLVFQVELGEESESGGAIVYAHSNKNLFSPKK